MPNLLTRKIGPYPVWAWSSMVAGVGVVTYLVIRSRRKEETPATAGVEGEPIDSGFSTYAGLSGVPAIAGSGAVTGSDFDYNQSTIDALSLQLEGEQNKFASYQEFAEGAYADAGEKLAYLSQASDFYRNAYQQLEGEYNTLLATPAPPAPIPNAPLQIPTTPAGVATAPARPSSGTVLWTGAGQPNRATIAARYGVNIGDLKVTGPGELGKKWRDAGINYVVTMR